MSPLVGTNELKTVPIDRIRPGRHQARWLFEPAGLEELAESIRAHGIVQPVVLRSSAPGYELLAGERRWRAAQLAGLQELPAVIRDDLTESEALSLGLIENLQRESLTPIETAMGLNRLAQAFALTHEQIGTRIGKSREYVSNFLRLLQLQPEVQALVSEARLSNGHAKVLAGLEPSVQRHWARLTVREGLSVRAMERRIAAERVTPSPSNPTKDSDWAQLELSLSERLGCPVVLESDARGRGELRLKFHSLDELDGLLNQIGYRRGP